MTLPVQTIELLPEFRAGTVPPGNLHLLENPEPFRFRSGGEQEKFRGVLLQIPAVPDEISHLCSRRVTALKNQITAVAVCYGEVDHPAAEFGREFPKRFCCGGGQRVAAGRPAAVGGERGAASVARPPRNLHQVPAVGERLHQADAAARVDAEFFRRGFRCDRFAVPGGNEFQKIERFLQGFQDNCCI